MKFQTDTGDFLKFYDYLDQADKELPVLINAIFYGRPLGFMGKKFNCVQEQIIEYRPLLQKNAIFFEYIRFPWLWEVFSTLVRSLNGEAFSVKDSIFEDKLYSDIDQDGWKFMETQQDADRFKEKTYDLHDSIITEIGDISGVYVA